MSAETLRKAAGQIRAEQQPQGDAQFCQCEESDNWFDRSICPEPCGSMHNICTECGLIQGYCPVAAIRRESGDRLAAAWLAVGDWLNACALVLEASPSAVKQHAMNVARAYLGEQP